MPLEWMTKPTRVLTLNCCIRICERHTRWSVFNIPKWFLCSGLMSTSVTSPGFKRYLQRSSGFLHPGTKKKLDVEIANRVYSKRGNQNISMTLKYKMLGILHHISLTDLSISNVCFLSMLHLWPVVLGTTSCTTCHTSILFPPRGVCSNIAMS